MADILTMHNTKAGRVFEVCNILFLGGVGAITILQFLYIIAGSFAT
ncbi:ABC transporter permease, partial [Bacillus vallismortis]|nr:ABC transporter permease [Bacillus vallismortis]